MEIVPAIIVVADVFEGLSRVKRQQMVYRYLNDSITSGLFML